MGDERGAPMDFVSEQQLEESKKDRAGDGTAQRGSPLFEILKENKDAEFNERFNHRPPEALDEDETESLDNLQMSKREYEQKLADQDSQELMSFQAAVAAQSLIVQEIEETPPTSKSQYNNNRGNEEHINGANNHNHDDYEKCVLKKPKLCFITEAEIRKEFAHHQKGIARLNNGSFGSCPASIIAAQKAWQLKFLQQPDDFFLNHLQKGILRSRSLIKSLINADHVDEVSLVDNATTAAAIVLQDVGWAFAEGRFQKGDAVVMLHCAFQAVKKSIEAYVTRAGGSVIVVQLPFPVHSVDEIIAEFRKGLAQGKALGGKVRLAIIDHITSMPCLVIPVKELVAICREENVERVFVDAAHAIGSVPVDVKEIGADFYVSNLHKWLFCPPSVAFLYCRKSPISPDLHHPVVSHEYGNGLAIESAWIGTRDYSSQLVVPEVLDFINRFEGGIDGVSKRNHDVVVEMARMLAKAWGTNLGSPPEMCPGMAMIGLPPSLGLASDDDALYLRTHLRDSFSVEVPIHYQAQKDGHAKVARGNEECVTGYVRISHQVYNTQDDYIRLRDAINQLVREGVTCNMLRKE